MFIYYLVCFSYKFQIVIKCLKLRVSKCHQASSSFVATLNEAFLVFTLRVGGYFIFSPTYFFWIASLGVKDCHSYFPEFIKNRFWIFDHFFSFPLQYSYTIMFLWIVNTQVLRSPASDCINPIKMYNNERESTNLLQGHVCHDRCIVDVLGNKGTVTDLQWAWQESRIQMCVPGASWWSRESSEPWLFVQNKMIFCIQLIPDICLGIYQTFQA